MRCLVQLHEQSLSRQILLTSEFLVVGTMASNLLKALIRSQILPSSRRNFSVATTQLGIPTDDLVGNHTAKWMQVIFAIMSPQFSSSFASQINMYEDLYREFNLGITLIYSGISLDDLPQGQIVIWHVYDLLIRFRSRFILLKLCSCHMNWNLEITGNCSFLKTLASQS